jgi:hypothetical protein
MMNLISVMLSQYSYAQTAGCLKCLNKQQLYAVGLSQQQLKGVHAIPYTNKTLKHPASMQRPHAYVLLLAAHLQVACLTLWQALIRLYTAGSLTADHSSAAVGVQLSSVLPCKAARPWHPQH